VDIFNNKCDAVNGDMNSKDLNCLINMFVNFIFVQIIDVINCIC